MTPHYNAASSFWALNTRNTSTNSKEFSGELPRQSQLALSGEAEGAALVQPAEGMALEGT